MAIFWDYLNCVNERRDVDLLFGVLKDVLMKFVFGVKKTKRHLVSFYWMYQSGSYQYSVDNMLLLWIMFVYFCYIPRNSVIWGCVYWLPVPHNFFNFCPYNKQYYKLGRSCMFSWKKRKLFCCRRSWDISSLEHKSRILRATCNTYPEILLLPTGNTFVLPCKLQRFKVKRSTIISK